MAAPAPAPRPAATSPARSAAAGPAPATNPASSVAVTSSAPAAAATSSSAAGPQIAAATQTIPNFAPNSADNSSSSNGSSGGGGSSLPTGAIAAIAVIAALVGLFLAWRIFLLIRTRQARSKSNDLPTDARETTAGFGTTSGTSSMAWLGNPASVRRGTSYYSYNQASIGPPSPTISNSTGQFAPPATPWTAVPGSPSSPGTPTGSVRGSRPASLYVDTSVGAIPNSYDVSGSATPHRSASPAPGSVSAHARDSSARSVAGVAAAARRSMYHNGYSVTPNFNSAGLTPGRSGVLPHSPYSRVEIIPPTPLSRPTTVVAVDNQTLAFSDLSGLNENGDWFSGSEGSPGPNALPLPNQPQGPTRESIEAYRNGYGGAGSGRPAHSPGNDAEVIGHSRSFSDTRGATMLDRSASGASTNHAYPESEFSSASASRPGTAGTMLDRDRGRFAGPSTNGTSSDPSSGKTSEQGHQEEKKVYASRSVPSFKSKGEEGEGGEPIGNARPEEGLQGRRSRDAAMRLSEGVQPDPHESVIVPQVTSPLDQLRDSLKGMSPS